MHLRLILIRLRNSTTVIRRLPVESLRDIKEGSRARRFFKARLAGKGLYLLYFFML